MRKADGARVVAGVRDAEVVRRSGTLDRGRQGDGAGSDGGSTFVRITGPKNAEANGYPGVLTYRDLSVSDITSSGAFIDDDNMPVMAEEVNNGTLKDGRRYRCDVWGMKDWTDSGDVDRRSMFVQVDANTSNPVSCSAACGWFAGATEYDCWTLTVVSATGNMDSLDLSQTLSLAWVADVGYPDGGYWESATDFTICDFTGHVILWRDAEGEPQLKLVAANYVLTLSCCDEANQTLNFNGGNSGVDVLCCARETNEGPAFNTFRLAVAWGRCPNPDYTTSGWYCVAVSNCAGTRECCFLTEDPGLGVILCSGPHADQATCAPLCDDSGGPTPPADLPCCAGLPAIIFITFTGVLSDLGTVTLTWNVGNARYEGSAVGCGGPNDIYWTWACVGDDLTGSLFIVQGAGSHAAYLSGANPAECSPIFASSSVNIINTGGVGACDGNFGFFVTE